MSIDSINKRLNDFISKVSPLYDEEHLTMWERHETNRYKEDEEGCDKCAGTCTPEKKSKCGGCKGC